MAGLHFDTSKFDRKHLRNQKRSQKKLQSLFNAFYKEVAKIGSATGWNPDGEASGTVAKEFYLRDYPQAQKQMRALLQGLCDDITTNIEDGNEEAFDTSMVKNTDLINSVGVSTPMPNDLLPEVQKRCETALSAFQGRKVSGMGLSERVWAIGQGMMPQIEMALELGLSEGRNAASLSRDVRRYLNEPERLFRRVRDKDGVLRLSKNAKAYHSGQGVYRSSYKNALRLTVTENNMAYRTADHEQWNGMPFVVGIEIQTSGNHPVADICDELKGTYPKEFKFTGWHPFCRCFATPKLCSREELNKWARMSDAERAKYQFEGGVKNVPNQFNKWIKDNSERIASSKSLPYFIKDNYKGGKVANGLRWEKKPHEELKEIRERRKQIQSECKEKVTSTIFRHKDFGHDVVMSGKDIKEWLNQPHIHIAEKNELLLDIEEVFKSSKYLGHIPNYKDKPQLVCGHLFETEIEGDKTWIIVNQYQKDGFHLHTVTDSPKVLEGLEKQ